MQVPKNKKKKPTPKRISVWTPFIQTTPNITQEAFQLDPEGIANTLAMFNSGQLKMYQNSLYTVMVRTLDANNDDGVIHLSIRHNDRKPIRDWRHFQRIKNELVSAEREALELYPAESRLVDEANQYHLWVLPTGEIFPLGFNEGRLVGGSDEASEIGAKQREYEVESEMSPPNNTLATASLTADAEVTKAKQPEGELITSDGATYTATPPEESGRI